MDGNKIKVSVIIPVYNAEKYLRQCLDSVLNQTLKEIEVICVDDGSTDKSAAILKEYSQKDSRVSVYTQVNQYAGVARNNGMSHANGEYIHFMDADDYMDTDAYRILYSKITQCNADVIKFGAICFDNKGIERYIKYYQMNIFCDNFDYVTTFYEYPVKSISANVAPWSGFYKREFLIDNNIKFSNLACAEDRLFNAHILLLSRKTIYIHNEFIYHRVENGGASLKYRTSHFKCLNESFLMITQLCKTINVKYKLIIYYAELKDLLYWYLRCMLAFLYAPK